MRVVSRIAHLDGTGTLREEGAVYELTAEPELSLRLKDYIVVPAPEQPAATAAQAAPSA